MPGLSLLVFNVKRTAAYFTRRAFYRLARLTKTYRRLKSIVESQLASRIVADPCQNLSFECDKELYTSNYASVCSHKPRVSIIVSTYNRAQLLARLLASLEYLRFRHFEVLVVAGPSSDETAQVLTAWEGRVKRLSCKERNLSLSRNIGVAHARGDILAFIDDDAVPEPDWLSLLVEAMIERDVVAAGGGIRDWTGVNFQCRALTVDGLAVVRPAFHTRVNRAIVADRHITLTGTNFCVWRAAVLRIRGYDESFRYFLEESDLQRRLLKHGGLLAYVDEAEVHHGRVQNVVRDARSLPSDFETPIASLVHFCLVHGVPGGEDTAIVRRITQELVRTRVRIRALVKRQRIDRPRARALWRSALRGILRGAAAQQQYGGFNSQDEAEAFLPFVTARPLTGVMRLAIVHLTPLTTPEQRKLEQLAERISKQGHELTVISPHACSSRVEFLGGWWCHRVRTPTFPAPGAAILASWTLAGELRRIQLRRRFDFVVVVQNAGRRRELRVISNVQRVSAASLLRGGFGLLDAECRSKLEPLFPEFAAFSC